VKEKKLMLNTEENLRTVCLSDLYIAAHLFSVALWVAVHMRDEKCYEKQAAALMAYQIAHFRDSTLDPLVSTYMMILNRRIND